jgi:hypothetical protein
MQKGSSKRPRKREDESQAAVRVMNTIAARSEADTPDVDPPVEITDAMRAAAAAFGRMGGKLGGPARAASLSPKKRSEIAKKAAAARWGSTSTKK